MCPVMLVLLLSMSSAQSYDIAQGDSETFLVLGDTVHVDQDVGVVIIEDVQEVAPGVQAVRLYCSSSPTGRCTGSIGPG